MDLRNKKVNKVICIDKKVGISSYDVIRDIKKKLISEGLSLKGPNKVKVGHAGTLDPFASGVLLILLGDATKKFDYFQTQKKVYEVTGLIGLSTDSYDITGKITNIDNWFLESIGQDVFTEDILKKYKNITEEDKTKLKNNILNSLKKQTGEIDQMPPAFSAKKINGKKAYELARKGIEVKLASKKVNIYSNELIDFNYPFFSLRVECSSGTYIRTIIDDIGKDIGVPCVAYSLRRTRIGEYCLD